MQKLGSEGSFHRQVEEGGSYDWAGRKYDRLVSMRVYEAC